MTRPPELRSATGAGSPADRSAVVLVVGCAPVVAAALTADVRTVSGDALEPLVTDDAAAAITLVHQIDAAGGIVPLAFVETDLGGDRGAASAVALHQDPVASRTRLVLVTSRVTLHGVDEALQAGAVQGMITRPWTLDGLRPLVKAHLATYLVTHAADRLDQFDGLLDDDDRQLARTRAELQRARTSTIPHQDHPLLDPTVDPDELERRLVASLDRALGHPPRIRVAPGTVLIEEDDDVGGIYVLLDGVVRLTSTTPTGEHILHERSTGPILGVLSLASHQRAMLRCQAVTDVRAIPVTIDQLARAFTAEPELAGLLLQVLLQALAGRLRRSDELQVELDRSLAELTAARAQLVATARFTAVGEMAAGMAHELNNPAAALERAMSHLLDDLAAVIGDDEIIGAVGRHLDAAPIGTAELRARRRHLSDALGDRHLADRLLTLGIDDPDEARTIAGRGDSTLQQLEAAARLGETVRSVTQAAAGIVGLVGSLRGYLRGDDARGPLVPDVEVATGVDDALRLLAHRVGDVVVDRAYEPVPPITARPGALQQVWTNLIGNALDAMKGNGRLTVTVRRAPPDQALPHQMHPDHVLVSIADDGPGVPEEIRPRIFEPRFTTKRGRVEFGMGLGLSISRQIVMEHGGDIEFESRPGSTVFTVTLPIDGSPGVPQTATSQDERDEQCNADTQETT